MFWRQKHFDVKKFLTSNFFDVEALFDVRRFLTSTTFLASTIFWRQYIFWPQQFVWRQKLFDVNKCFDVENLLTSIWDIRIYLFFQTWYFLGKNISLFSDLIFHTLTLKTFATSTIFLTSKFFWRQVILRRQNTFWRQYMLASENFFDVKKLLTFSVEPPVRRGVHMHPLPRSCKSCELHPRVWFFCRSGHPRVLQRPILINSSIILLGLHGLRGLHGLHGLDSLLHLFFSGCYKTF